MVNKPTYVELQDVLIPDNPLSYSLINDDWGIINTIRISVPDFLPSDCIMKISYLEMGKIADTISMNEQRVKFTGSAVKSNMVIRIKNNYINPSAIQKNITQIAYTLGAGYLCRWHFKHDANKEIDGGATMKSDFGCKTYKFIGGDAEIGDNNNEDLVELAYKHGHWVWEFNVALNGQGVNPYFNKWLKDDLSLNEHGGRKGDFPGWQKNVKHGIELMKHYDIFERSIEHGMCLSAKWDFAKLIPVLP